MPTAMAAPGPIRGEDTPNMDELSDDLIVRPADIFVLYANDAAHDRYEDLQDASTSAPEKD